MRPSRLLHLYASFPDDRRKNFGNVGLKQFEATFDFFLMIAMREGV